MTLTTGALVKFLVRVVIALIALSWSAWNIYFGIDSTAWPESACEIVSSDQKGNLVYQYSAQGIIYNGTLIMFGDSMLANSFDDLNIRVNSGHQLKARYNPDNPGMSCLLSGFHKLGVYIPLAIGLFFLTISGLELRARYLIR